MILEGRKQAKEVIQNNHLTIKIVLVSCVIALMILCINPVEALAANMQTKSQDSTTIITANNPGLYHLNNIGNNPLINSTNALELVKQKNSPSTYKLTSKAVGAIRVKPEFSVYAKKKKQTFSLKAKSLGGGKLSYSSNSKKIKVDENGIVTIPARYLGNATITIESEETDTYFADEEEVFVEATLKPPKIKVTSPRKGWLRISWPKPVVKVRTCFFLSRSKNLSNAGIIPWDKKKTTINIDGLKSGKRYYTFISLATDHDGCMSAIKSAVVK